MKTIPFYEIPNYIKELKKYLIKNKLKNKTADKYFSEMYSKIVLEAEKEISEYQSNTPY